MEKIKASEADVTITVALALQGVRRGVKQVQKDINGLKSSAISKGAVVGPFSVLNKTLPQATKNLKNFQGQMLGAGLGVMFFGMAIQRAFMNIWKTSSKVFTDVMASTTDATNGFTMLDGAMKFLGFTAGQALEPLAMSLIPFIMKLSEWISLKPKLFAQLVKWGVLIGGALFIIGQLALGINGVVQAVGLLSKLSFAKIGSALKAAFLGPTLWVILLIAGIVAAIVWISKMSKEMGGFGEFAKSVLRGVLRFFVLIGEGLIGIGVLMVNSFLNNLNKIIEGIDWVISRANDLFGTDMGEIGAVKTIDYQFGDAILGNYLDWEQEKLAPENGYASGNEGDPLYSAPVINIGTANIQTDTVDSLYETFLSNAE